MVKIDAAFLERFQNRADDNGRLNYRDFIDVSLYDPDFGYYKKSNLRVGRSPQTDFYTSESLGKVFAQLVVAATVEIVGSEIAAQCTFVEIGAEPNTFLLESLPDKIPFAAATTIRESEPLQIPERSIVFANEWLDALPFHRLVFAQNKWQERGVCINQKGQIEEIRLAELSPEVRSIRGRLPEVAPEGYELDLPLEAEKALTTLTEQDWSGLILLIDYGRTWKALTHDFPQGSARTFGKHRQGSDLLDSIGKIDITCDVDWTHAQQVLESQKFDSVTLESQESFLIQRSHQAAQEIVEFAASGKFSHDLQTLKELTHPANMGQRFQVLWGTRGL